MIRSLVKSLVGSALHRTGTDALLGRRAGMSHMPLVVAYHRVVEDFTRAARTSLPAMLIGVRTFERHLDWLGRGRDFISLDEVGARLEGGVATRRPAVAITFDDGYADVHEHAFPLLRRKGIPAAVFVTSDVIGTGRCFAHDHLFLLLSRFCSGRRAPLDHLRRLLVATGLTPPASDRLLAAGGDPGRITAATLVALRTGQVRNLIAQLREEVDPEPAERALPRLLDGGMITELSAAGITIGSHTRSHALLDRADPVAMHDELRGSRADLERRVGRPVTHFAYPDGWFHPAVVRAVRTVGYQYGYTTCVHRDPTHPRLTIPRRVLWERSATDWTGRFSPALMGCQVNRVFESRRRCRHEPFTAPVASPTGRRRPLREAL